MASAAIELKALGSNGLDDQDGAFCQERRDLVEHRAQHMRARDNEPADPGLARDRRAWRCSTSPGCSK